MIEKDIDHISRDGYWGLIVPISAIAGSKFSSLQQMLFNENSQLFIDSYAKRPCKIFNKVEQRLVILHGKKKSTEDSVSVYTCGHKRWYRNERKKIFQGSNYILCKHYNLRDGTIPKLKDKIENEIIRKMFLSENPSVKYYYADKNTDNDVIYHASSGYWLKAFNYIPEFYSEKRGETKSSEYKAIKIKKEYKNYIFMCLLNSSLFYWYWIIFSDERHFTKKDIDEFPFDYHKLDDQSLKYLHHLSEKLMDSYKEHAINRTVNLGGNTGIVKYQEFHPKYSKDIIDEIDQIIGKVYGFNDEEIKFIINYDIRFRMGDGGIQENEL